MISEKYKYLLQYSGNPDQTFFAQRMRLCEGVMDGLDVIEVDNGSGLRFWVFPGRCMDIGRLSFRGINVSFLSKAGFSNSAYYDAAGMNGLNTFAPGFLTTCGLRNSGLPCEVGGEEFGFHGRIGQTPADSIGIYRETESERPSIRITGRVKEGRLFGPHLELFRTITVWLQENKIEIVDRITNLAAIPEDCMMLYHFNLGYPFLTENARFATSHQYEKPVDENARKFEGQRLYFKKPVAQMPENCFYYRQSRDEQGHSYAACLNEEAGFGVVICTNPEELPLLCNWQSWAAGDYVMGIEPCTCYGDGRAAHQKRQQMITLQPYESRTHHLTICFPELDEEIWR
nr:aldose 1-epimerase family protein [uncultured Oscillibacter sp.]